MMFRWLNAKQPADKNQQLESKNFYRGKFQNVQPYKRQGNWALARYVKRLFTDSSKNRIPSKPIDIEPVTLQALMELDSEHIHLCRLGHSSILLKLAGKYWLIDPVFSQRASPFSFLGPKRFHPAPISIEQLPAITGVIISHNHYDHLDRASIKALIAKTEHFYAPLGVDGDLINWGVDRGKISTFDWWQTQTIGDTCIHFTPSQHYSGRGPDDNSSTLWGSWIIECSGQSMFFCGDSGYCSSFKDIGDKYGPFDLCLIEAGAYDTQWPSVHMQPKESIQAFLDLKGQALLPIHNSTFNLAFHPWNHPLESISALAALKDIKVLIPKFGQIVTVGQPLQQTLWWHNKS